MTDDITARIADIATDVLRGNAILGEAIAEQIVQQLGLEREYNECTAGGSCMLRDCGSTSGSWQ